MPAQPLTANSSPSTGPAAGPVFDADCLQRIRALDPQGRQGSFERVMRTFERSLARMQLEMLQAHGVGDVQAMRDVVHKLKSSAGSIGALDLARLCIDIENCLRLPQNQGMEELLLQWQSEAARVLAALRQMLAKV